MVCRCPLSGCAVGDRSLISSCERGAGRSCRREARGGRTEPVLAEGRPLSEVTISLTSANSPLGGKNTHRSVCTVNQSRWFISLAGQMQCRVVLQYNTRPAGVYSSRMR